MEQVQKLHDQYVDVVDKALDNVPAARCFQEKTGVRKAYGAIGIGAVSVLLILFNIGAPLLVNLFGFGFAAYQSMNAIESPGKEDDAQWLTYWVIFGFFNVVEYFTGFILYWIPFFYILKLAFLGWLMLPNTRGAEKLYHGSLKPFIQAKLNKVAAASPAPAAANPKQE
ncbi:ER membrane protein DP1/Yop1 [Linderina pennispora]|nr:ER membrane protein DP1/Yop1 [Linderina pennispora]